MVAEIAVARRRAQGRHRVDVAGRGPVTQERAVRAADRPGATCLGSARPGLGQVARNGV